MIYYSILFQGPKLNDGSAAPTSHVCAFSMLLSLIAGNWKVGVEAVSSVCHSVYLKCGGN
jgi:hypothetical protein